MSTELWSAYVRRLLELSGKSEAAFVRDLTVQQGTFNRWKTGASSPDRAADVAKFAQDCGRNVLEAFIAADMLTIDEAGKGLPVRSRRFLESLSDEAPSVDLAIAAHEDGSIAGEQESTNET